MLTMDIRPIDTFDRANRPCANTPWVDFFPDTTSGLAEAREVCRSCPATVECLTWAIYNKERHGVWGGTSERQRRSILRQTIRYDISEIDVAAIVEFTSHHGHEESLFAFLQVNYPKRKAQK